MSMTTDFTEDDVNVEDDNGFDFGIARLCARTKEFALSRALDFHGSRIGNSSTAADEVIKTAERFERFLNAAPVLDASSTDTKN